MAKSCPRNEIRRICGMREFHIHRKAREAHDLDESVFSSTGTVIFANLGQARELARKLKGMHQELRYQDLYAMGLIDEIMHIVVHMYTKDIGRESCVLFYDHCVKIHGQKLVNESIKLFATNFPPVSVYKKAIGLDEYLEQSHDGVLGYAIEFEEMLMLWLENKNEAFAIASSLFDDGDLRKGSNYLLLMDTVREFFNNMPLFGPDNQNLVDMLRAPAIAFPNSLEMQLEFIRERWGYLLGDILMKLMRGIDFLKEANAYFLKRGMGGIGKETHVLDYSGAGGAGQEEYERFSPDRDWMPRVVILAKTTLVWLDQLSKKFGRTISTLEDIPDEELDEIASRGFNTLWLIGLWRRSDASRKIKHRCGNPEAAASAYALDDYDIADEIGGWHGLNNLRKRAWHRGIRMASDMVPNHTGIDGKWVHEHPDWFIQSQHSPFPGYTYNSENLSDKPGIGIYLEDHYYDKTDAAVTFKRVDFSTGDTRFIYHGNDGTHMPWNDTAQLNFLNAEVREAIIQTILHVARNFPVIRFDAAMTLAKRHIQRLWFPEPGRGGDIPSRAEYGISTAAFNAAIPVEFWREVVDRVATEAPDTLLLAEAFWMMEGYFVRTLGMHRVYNSAFMNMLKNEENAKYRQTIKNTVGFDKDILKRFVNFMNNPDEETAIAQFGSGDKYFGVCTLMATMPGLPMFGHGQVEGFTEKYGMEFRRAYKDEAANGDLVGRHYHEIFPLLRKRYLFADVESFYLYDMYKDNGSVDENVFAYSNRHGAESALVLYNNVWESTFGTIRLSAGFVNKNSKGDRHLVQRTIGEAMGLRDTDNRYTLLREQRSNLWFIRKSSEICRAGLRVVLQGYQCQVYLDIHELEDNQSGHYRLLHDHLSGRGIADIQEGMRELVLKPIFTAFERAIDDEMWAVGLSLFDGRATADTATLVQRYTNFIAQTMEYAANKKSYQLAPQVFEKNLASVADVFKFLTVQAQDKKTGTFARDLLKAFSGGEIKRALLLLLMTGPIQADNEEWQLENRVPGIGIWNELLRYLWPALSLEVIKPVKQTIDSLELFSSLEVQDYLLVNYYDGIRWYNQERFENFLPWLAVFSIAAVDVKDQHLLTNIAGQFVVWNQCRVDSEYKFDVFKELLADLLEPKKVSKSRKVIKST